MKPLLFLPHPKPKSHKGQNGVILIIGGSRTYHGAPILAALAARRFCDLVYFYSTPENQEVIKRMKVSTPNVICVPKSKFSFALNHADCVLVGNGMDVNKKTKKVVEKMLMTKKRCVLDASAIRVLPCNLLHENVIVTPHIREFEAGFEMKATEKNIVLASKKHNCTILLKGATDIIASQGKLVKVKGGNAGMTKGGTGDALAGLCAAIFSICSSPARAAYTASVLNKRAGELLFKKMKYNFCSEDLVDALPLAAAKYY